MPPVLRPATVTRKVHFYRAVVTPTRGSATAYDPTDALTHIDGLPFTSAGRYLDDGDRTYCCWVNSAATAGRLRYAIVRRDGLPTIEDGGQETDLALADTAGLVEQIHVCCFDHNIVGCEFNQHGPRLPSLSYYLRERGGPNCQKVAFEPLVRRDVVDLLDAFDGVRTTTLAVRRSELDHIAAADADLGAALRAQERLATSEVLEITWRVKPYSRTDTLGAGMFDRVKKLARRTDIHELVDRFSVEAVPDADGGGRSQPVNILDDRLVSEVEIARPGGRGRTLDHDSAFDAIGTAHAALEDELLKAASVGSTDGN